MTQTAPTRPRALKYGTRVRHRRDPELAGVIRQPDAFYLALCLRGVAMSGQKLIHWPEADVCTWERNADLIPEETP